MVLSEELIHQLFIVTVYGSPRKPWSHPPPPPPPCCSFFTLATSSSLFFLLQYYNGGHTTHDVKMGELSFELTSSQHRDYCRNDRWKQGDRLLYLHPYLGEGVRTSDDDYAITCRWPADHPTVIHRQLTDLSTSAGDRREPCRASAGAPAMAAGQSPGKLAICSLVRPITMRVPDGDRQAIADPVITVLQDHENRPAIYRCAKIEIRQKSAKNPWIAARFIKLVTSPLQIQTADSYRSILCFH